MTIINGRGETHEFELIIEGTDYTRDFLGEGWAYREEDDSYYREDADMGYILDQAIDCKYRVGDFRQDECEPWSNPDNTDLWWDGDYMEVT